MSTTSASRLPAAIRLGVNIDHVGTLRQARGTDYPDPVEAALLAAAAGADGITLHLREDRRHIQDHDLERLLPRSPVPVNLELAATPELLAIACRLKPTHACLVPERREERTTEGGLDVAAGRPAIAEACARLAEAGIAVALFVDPEIRQLEAVLACGTPHLEINTGRYADALTAAAQNERLAEVASFAHAAHMAGLEVHAGHGLNLDNVAPVAALPEIAELNIGHSIIARALYVGLPAAVAEMRRAMAEARAAKPA